MLKAWQDVQCKWYGAYDISNMQVGNIKHRTVKEAEMQQS